METALRRELGHPPGQNRDRWLFRGAASRLMPRLNTTRTAGPPLFLIIADDDLAVAQSLIEVCLGTGTTNRPKWNEWLTWRTNQVQKSSASCPPVAIRCVR